MNYTWKISDSKSYDLRLKTIRLMQMEERLGCNPLMIFGRDGDLIPTTKQMITIIHAAIQDDSLMTEDVVADLVDEWFENGHTYSDLITLITDIYRASGLIDDGEAQEKNPSKPKKSK